MLRFSLPRSRPPRIRLRRNASSASVMATEDGDTDTNGTNGDGGILCHEPLHRISEEYWRKSSRDHSDRIREIISPGLTPLDHPLNTGLQRQKRQQERMEHRRKRCEGRQFPEKDDSSVFDATIYDTITALDPRHPVYNFLIEYYGLKGTKGVRRLLKWSPGMDEFGRGGATQQQRIQEGILLEGATDQDFFTSLHAKGAVFLDEDENHRGVVFSPLKYVYGNRSNVYRRRGSGDKKENLDETSRTETRANKCMPSHSNGGPVAPFLWYRSLLRQTLEATPVLHCYGLHEWAMQYQPTIPKGYKDDKNSLPASSKYQSHLKLRIRQETLNETVEANTLFCSHVDAWKFFAKEALPQNQFGKPNANNRHQTVPDAGGLLPSASERPGWLLRSEQPACVHTTMDLLKIALKLGPFCDPNLFRRVLTITIEARFLDVAASPYDAFTDYGVDPIFVETPSGRHEYKQRQIELMKKATPIRKDLLENYEQFLSVL